jgi:hypothetical protein
MEAGSTDAQPLGELTHYSNEKRYKEMNTYLIKGGISYPMMKEKTCPAK